MKAAAHLSWFRFAKCWKWLDWHDGSNIDDIIRHNKNRKSNRYYFDSYKEFFVYCQNYLWTESDFSRWWRFSTKIMLNCTKYFSRQNESCSKWSQFWFTKKSMTVTHWFDDTFSEIGGVFRGIFIHTQHKRHESFAHHPWNPTKQKWSLCFIHRLWSLLLGISWTL